ncbi:unnamed protein product, partial [Ectocarpus sp. 12 AP-2014]
MSVCCCCCCVRFGAGGALCVCELVHVRSLPSLLFLSVSLSSPAAATQSTCRERDTEQPLSCYYHLPYRLLFLWSVCNGRQGFVRPLRPLLRGTRTSWLCFFFSVDSVFYFRARE